MGQPFGQGRKKGAANLMTRVLAHEIKGASTGDEIGAGLVALIENPKKPIPVRLEACRRLFGLTAGRILYPGTVQFDELERTITNG